MKIMKQEDPLLSKNIFELQKFFAERNRETKEIVHKHNLEGWIFFLVVTIFCLIATMILKNEPSKEWTGEGEPPSEYEMRGGATWGN